MLAHLRERWFLLALVAVLVAGLAWPGVVQPIARWIPRQAVVALVMFLMALPMELRVMWDAMRRPGPAWLGAFVNAGLAPPLGWLASRLLPADLAIGVIVAATVPCTLAAATVWTRRAGGNDAVAILVTLITNLACVVVAPAWLRLLVGSAAAERAGVDYGDLILQLALLVIVPIAVAQLARQWPAIAAGATAHKKLLSDVAQLGILSMVLVGAVGCGERINELENGASLAVATVALMIAVVIAVHLALLIAGFHAAKFAGMSRADAIAVGIAGSQKTIMVGLYLAMCFGPLAILPMVAYHAAQLVLDTLVADRWARQSS